MDPRHPELAISRIDELMTQYKRAISDMQTCSISSKLAQLERECGLVVQEICLVAPRLHEAMIQVSRTRRAALAHGIVEEKPVENPYEKMREYAATAVREEDVNEIPEKVDIPEPDVNEKPKKKKTTKKKKAEE